MKYILVILSLLFLTSCNPFMNKDLRRKNRGNRKLERLIKRFPNLEKGDTLIASFDTIIITEPTKVDTFFSMDFDTLEIIKDKFHLKLIKTTDTLLIEGGCISDTIYIDREIKVPFERISKDKLTVIEEIITYFSRYWNWLFYIGVITLFLFLLKKVFLSK